MQWIAMITMLIDHIGAIFYPDQLIYRLIGRIAFPIYVFLSMLGYQRTSNFKRYFIRLITLALVSQLPFQLAFDTNHINAIGTLTVSVAVLKCIDIFKQKYILNGIIILIAAILLQYLNFDYGAYGLLLMLIYRFFIHKPAIVLLAQLTIEILFIFISHWGIQFFSLFVTLFLAYRQQLLVQLDRLRAPNWLWRLFYPIHLTFLCLIVRFVLEK